MSVVSVSFYKVDGTEIPQNSIVVFGGDRDIELSTQSHDPRVAGVSIDQSADPEVTLTNFSFFACETYAVIGRVGVRVKGPINKGDCVVTSNEVGVGQKLDASRYVHGCILGKAMGEINDTSIQIIEVAVGIK
jgi:hypothetical protein